ncbi:hypothetical protein [Marisediminicola antarctica]|uniref:Cardiolipin synthase N-terminal domain-containing protein n=1 Tax=Marisediminicola antarctica TaxID=674079 RepID=A0A7L5AGB2_9MICO|nr:hypothetical protein [Marisediminicola antarctica]QHO69558.1 hypothetical protein BHD05_07800 [Marisediminicola antarctica]
MNPLIPAVSDVLWALVFILNLVLVVVALVSLARDNDKRGWVTTVLMIFILPIVGPIVSLIAARLRRATPAR